MKKQREAGFRGIFARRGRSKKWGTTTPLCVAGYCFVRSARTLATKTNRAAAFTLIEMLVVIAIVAILSALTLPALQGLTGTSGLRGGVNTVTVTLDQARAAAIENGTSVYVGLPPPTSENPKDPFLNYASLIVFRGAKPSESNNTFVPLSRWIRLPPGIAMLPTNMTLTNLTPSVAEKLPKLAGQPVNPLVIEYDRFGRIRTPVTAATNLVIGEAIISGTQLNWKGNNREALTAQRLTGRWLLSRP